MHIAKSKISYFLFILTLLCACADTSPERQYQQALPFLQTQPLDSTALALLQQAAQAGHGPAAYKLAQIYDQLRQNNLPSPMYQYWLERARDLGQQEAANDLEQYYKYHNHPQYLALLKEKAQQGDKPAQREVGFLLEQGYGGFKGRFELSQAWFHEYAPTWSGDQVNDLAICYQYGYQVQLNLPQAIFWYEKAIAMGCNEANTNLGVVYILQSPTQLRAPSKGFAYVLKGAQNGSARGMCVVGEAYQHGVGVDKNLNLARQWHEKSHQAGYAPGTYYLAKMLLNGWGGPRDTTRALRLFQKVGESSDDWVHALGYLQIGHMYRQGLGVNKNNAQAVKYYQQAASMGSQRAMYWLGYMYEKGWGVKADRQRAANWYRQALVEPEPVLHPMRLDQSLASRDIVAESNQQIRQALSRLGIK